MMAEKKLPPVVLSLPVQGAWIEIQETALGILTRLSLPVQGAWIEMARGCWAL